jgi:hypothetical protein
MHTLLTNQVKDINELNYGSELIELHYRYGYFQGYSLHTISHITSKRQYIITKKGDKLEKLYHLYHLTDHNRKLLQEHENRKKTLQLIADTTFDNLSLEKLIKIKKNYKRRIKICY